MGLKKVAEELRQEASEIETAYPNQMIKPEYSERADLVAVLSNAYAGMAADIRGVARTCGLTMPEKLK